MTELSSLWPHFCNFSIEYEDLKNGEAGQSDQAGASSKFITPLK